jgi:hypothetical protein
MENSKADRRGFLRKMVAVVGGLAAVPMLSRTAQAGRSHWRGYGYGYRRSGYRRGWGGYRYRGYGYGPGYYRGYSGVPYGGYYGRGYSGVPYGGYYGRGYSGVPYGGYYGPYYGGYGGYGGYGVGIPMLKREEPRAIDALSLLEC